MAAKNDLFDKKYINRAAALQELKSGFVVRPLSKLDYDKGFLDTLSNLTTIGNISKADFHQRFDYLQKHHYEYFTIVVEDEKEKKIVGSGTIFVERKFIHHNGLVGHIEDIVTHKDYRGFNLGRIIIETLKHIGSVAGCYKIILDCSEKNVAFYNKCGFERKEVEMVYYIKENDVPNAKAKL